MNRFRIWRAAWTGVLLGLMAGFQFVVRVPASGNALRDFALAIFVFIAVAVAAGVLEGRLESMLTARWNRGTEQVGGPAELVAERV